jgi:Spy/CpxP family protein refolding chaperone
MRKLILSAALMSAFAACNLSAQPMMPGLPPPPGGGAPSAEMLATTDLTTAQQADVRRILMQKRDALDAAEGKLRAQAEALHKQMRDEHERIDAQTSDQLRKELGDDAYKRYAEWSLRHEHGPMGGPEGPRGPGGMHGPHGDKGAPGTPPPGAGAGAGIPDDE